MKDNMTAKCPVTKYEKYIRSNMKDVLFGGKNNLPHTRLEHFSVHDIENPAFELGDMYELNIHRQTST